LKEGQIVEHGTHDSLIKEKGFYAHLVSLQKMNSESIEGI
jgi:ABC-type multidrug transport system fused ATPase/permease subunit